MAVLIFLGGIGAGHWWGSEHSMVKQLTYDLEKTNYDLGMAKMHWTGQGLITMPCKMGKNIESIRYP